MKKIFISLLMLALGFTSFAQVNCSIKKACAFFTVSVPGMQMTDENGNPIPQKKDIARFIYFEWSGAQKPELAAVLYNNRPLSASLSAVAGNTVIPGNFPHTNSEFKITAKKGNSLWKIDLQPIPGNTMADLHCKNIMIKTRRSGKVCMFKPGKELELTAMPRY